MKLWSGRLDASTDPALDAINRSIGFDIRLWPYDVRASRAHATMLESVGLLSRSELDAIQQGLDTVTEELESGSFEIKAADEDVHTAVERRVTELAGEAGKKLHTARSRNDQVATDFRLFVLGAIVAIRGECLALARAFVARAKAHPDAVIPAYTHLQRGQPVLLAHHFLAYVEMLRRDVSRLDDAARRTSVSPLGSGACAGTSLPIDRQLTADELGFAEISRNSLDAVSDRDFAVELLSTISLIMIHLSRLGEELVLWTSKEFDFCRLDDRLSTGSSMMPQKKNPDGAELIRGKAGRVFGGLVTLLTTLKGLPLTYNKDLQEDKEPIFDAVDTVIQSLQVARAMIRTMTINEERMAGAISPDVFATDLAERLVTAGIPLRTAHHHVAQLVRQAESLGKSLTELTRDDIEKAGDSIPVDVDLIAMLDVKSSLEMKAIPGATAPVRVAEALAEAGDWLEGASKGL
jgi:argininosuccinate lyase